MRHILQNGMFMDSICVLHLYIQKIYMLNNSKGKGGHIVNSFISYNQEVQSGYLYLLSRNIDINIQCTKEITETSNFLLDLDISGRIIGIECFGTAAESLKKLVNQNKLYDKIIRNEKEYYACRLQSKKCIQQIHLNGVILHFADENYQEWIGIDIIDVEKYPRNILDALSY